MLRRQRGRFHGSHAPLSLAPLRCAVPRLVALHCTSGLPPPAESRHLRSGWC